MDCREARDLIQDLLDDRLDATERRGVEAHLDACPSCAEEHAALRRTVTLVRNMGRVSAPESLAGDVLARIGPGVRPAGRRFDLPLSIAGVSAAAALLLVCVLVFLPQGPVVPKDEVLTTDRGVATGEWKEGEEEKGSVGSDAFHTFGAEEERDADDALEPAAKDIERAPGVREPTDSATALTMPQEAEKASERVVEVRVKDPRAFAARVRGLLAAGTGRVSSRSGKSALGYGGRRGLPPPAKPTPEGSPPPPAGPDKDDGRGKVVVGGASGGGRGPAPVDAGDRLAKKGKTIREVPDIRLGPKDLRRLLAALERNVDRPAEPAAPPPASEAGAKARGDAPTAEDVRNRKAVRELRRLAGTVDLEALRRAIREADKRRPAAGIVLRLRLLPDPPDTSNR